MKISEKIFSLTNENNTKFITILGIKIPLISKRRELEYYKWLMEINKNPKSKNFVEITNTPIENKDINLIAFYLPQFHTIPLNDDNFGKGFTEWTNVTKAIPQFIGHNQPHLPYDVGFYDLSKPDIMYRQVELAKMYGLSGFCFHYYWFSGKRLLEKPIFNYSNNKDLDFPFCLCWANENWAKLWDGRDKEVIMPQEYKMEDAQKFADDIMPFMEDKRYIKIDNKPVLVIYRPSIIPEAVLEEFMKKMTNLAQSKGFDGIYFIIARGVGVSEVPPLSKNFVAEVEFPPHQLNSIKKDKSIKYINRNFNGRIVDIKKWIKDKKYLFEPEAKLFKCVFPNWDNTARKAYTGAWVLQTEPEEYKQWLKDCIIWTKNNHSKSEQFVFINAWNEWGEGAHLEPDQRYGYAYLQATKEAVEETYAKNS